MTDNPEFASQASLFAKMSRVMGKMSRVPKSGKNPHFNYKYATESDIADRVREAMAEESLCLFAQMLEVNQQETGKQIRTHAIFEFTFACGDTGATYSCRWEAEAFDSQDKGINKVATAALKYFLLKTFIISTGNPEDDSDSGHKQQDSTRPQPTPTEQKLPDEQPPAEDKIVSWEGFYKWCKVHHSLEKHEVDKALQGVNRGTAKKSEIVAIIEKYVADGAKGQPAQPKSPPTPPPDLPAPAEEGELISHLTGDWGFTLEHAQHILSKVGDVIPQELETIIDRFADTNPDIDADVPALFDAWYEAAYPQPEPTKKPGRTVKK